MLSKALFIDFAKGDIPADYFNRIVKLFKNVKLISRDDPNLFGALKDTEVVFSKIFTKIDKEFIDSSPRLRYIGVLSTAFDAIDEKYAKSKGVVVCNLGGYSTEAVSEFVLAVLFDHVRELKKAKIQAAGGDFSFANFMGKDLRGRTLGVVGAGRIGSRIVELGLGVGMNVTYSSRKRKANLEKLGAKHKSLEILLSSNEFIALSLALNKETKNVLNKKRISLLKKGSVLISIAPPPLIDNEAVLARANKGDIIFIFDHADNLDKNLAKRFLKSKGSVVYPAIAFRTEEANTNKFETFASNIETFAKGKLQNKVN